MQRYPRFEASDALEAEATICQLSPLDTMPFVSKMRISLCEELFVLESTPLSRGHSKKLQSRWDSWLIPGTYQMSLVLPGQRTSVSAKGNRKKSSKRRNSKCVN